MRYWILNINTDFCTIDDLCLHHHGWSFDKGEYEPSVLRGDVAVLFESGKQKFHCLGRFMTAVAFENTHDDLIRYDFLIDVPSRRHSPEKLALVRRRLTHPRHPVRSTRWLTRVLARLTRAEFDDLIAAWWGIPGFSGEIEMAAAGNSPGTQVKYAAYAYAFERLSDAIGRGYNLEAVAIAESIISDRIDSACDRVGTRRRTRSLSDKMKTASQMNPPLPKYEEFDLWREHRNQVLHEIVKGSTKQPLLRTTDFLELAERTAVKGAILARTASSWARKFK